MKTLSRLLHITACIPVLIVPTAAFAADHSWCVTGPAKTPNPGGDPVTYAVVSAVCSQDASCCNTAGGRWSVSCIEKGNTYAVTRTRQDICGGGAWKEGPISGTTEYYPRDFNLFTVTGDAASVQSVADPIATAGKFSVSGFSLNYNHRNPIALVSQGNVSLLSGTVVYGMVDYSAGYTAQNVTYAAGSPPTGPVVPSPIDFTHANTSLVAMSAALGDYPTNGTVTNQWGNVTFTGSDPELDVFSVAASAIANANNFTFSVPRNSHVIVNVTGTSPVLQNAGISGNTASNTLWNFPNALTLKLSSVGLPGSVLAPTATATLQNGNVSGSVVVASAPTASFAFGSAPFDMPGAVSMPSCNYACLCVDPTWSCSGNTVLDSAGHAVGISPEAGFLQLDSETYKGENVSRTSPTHRVWYSFQPAQSAPASKPLAVFFNGGPGSGTTPILFNFNTAPMTLDPQRTGGAPIAPNADSWTRFANLLYIDAPGTGFSYPVANSNGAQPDVGYDMDREAGMVASTLMRFLIRHPALQSSPVVIVGESYGGTRAQLLLGDIYNYANLTNSSASYNDAQLSADAAQYFRAVFGTATPTATQIAGKFSHQFLIEPALVGQQQWNHNAFSGTGCIDNDALCWQTTPPHLGNCDPYDCDQPANWSDNLEATASDNLVSNVSTLSTALGIDATTIEWMYGRERTAVYKHGAGNCSTSTQMTSTFGALGSGDCYLLTFNDDVLTYYGYGTGSPSNPWETNSRGTQVGTAFAQNIAAGVKSLVSVASFDSVVYSPAIPPALTDLITAGQLPFVSLVQYQPGTPYTPPLSTPGLTLLAYTSGATPLVAMPVYQAGHSVSERQPHALLTDAITWY